MDQILHTLVGEDYYLLIDGFSSFNQIWVKYSDQHKIAFTKKWGTFAFKMMPFVILMLVLLFKELWIRPLVH